MGKKGLGGWVHGVGIVVYGVGVLDAAEDLSCVDWKIL